MAKSVMAYRGISNGGIGSRKLEETQWRNNRSVISDGGNEAKSA
jgi:hypothetical protein